MRNRRTRFVASLFALILGALPALQAQTSTWTRTVVHQFTESRYAVPQLVAGPDGNMWGVTGAYGTASDTGYWGSVFKVTPAGVFTDVHRFTAAELGSTGTTSTVQFGAGLTVGPDGAFYGVLSATFSGTTPILYRVTASGDFSIVSRFPSAGVVNVPPTIDAAGNFYGQSSTAGANNTGYIFRVSSSGVFTDLYDCAVDRVDCGAPMGQLLEVTPGVFYGSSTTGGVNGTGNIYSYTVGGTLHVLASCPVTATDGCRTPQGGMVETSDGAVWGTSYQGGTGNRGVFYKITPDGSGGGSYAIVYNFADSSYAWNPYWGAPRLAGDGMLYGSTNTSTPFTYGGAAYEFDPSTAVLTPLYRWTSYSNDVNELSGVSSSAALAPDGSLWGGGISFSTNGFGGVYKAVSTTPISPGISLTVDKTVVDAGKPVVVTYAATNANSETAKQCYAFTNGLSGGLFTGHLSTSGTATITPTQAGTFTFSYSCSGYQIATATITVDSPALAINTTALSSGVVGSSYTAQLEAAGGTAPYKWIVASGLPAGLSIDTNTGLITGTPTQAGTSNFTVQVADSQSTPATASTSLAVTIAYPAVAVSTAALPSASVGSVYSQALAATGGNGVYAWSLASGTLPAGLTLNASGTITGTPTQTGTSTFSVRVSDSQANPSTATSSLSLTVAYPEVAIAQTTLAAGRVGTAYSQTLTATGGNGAYTWSVASGSLPAGLALSASGVISGTPTQQGTETFSVKATDGQATPASATSSLSLVVASAPVAPTVTLALAPSSIVPGGSTTLTATFSATAATGTVQFNSNGAALGAPVAVASGKATLQQIFATAGSYAITAVYSGDSNYATATSSAATLTVGNAAVTASPATITISGPGGSGTTTLNLVSFTSATTVTISCSGLPQGTTCNTTAPVTSGQATLTVTTTGNSAAVAPSALAGGNELRLAILLPGVFALVGLGATRNRRLKGVLTLLVLLSGSAAVTGCGGSSSSSSATPRGTSSLSVTVSSGSQSASVPVSLVVN
jgi:hypothetical protein